MHLDPEDDAGTEGSTPLSEEAPQDRLALTSPDSAFRPSPRQGAGQRGSPSGVSQVVDNVQGGGELPAAAQLVTVQPRIEYASVDDYVASRGGPEWSRPSSRRPPVAREIQ